MFLLVTNALLHLHAPRRGQPTTDGISFFCWQWLCLYSTSMPMSQAERIGDGILLLLLIAAKIRFVSNGAILLWEWLSSFL